jgi:predicted secreted protein
MWLRAFSLLMLCLAPSGAFAAEALALKVFGFSPDGKYFGFMQYGGVGDGGEYIAEAHVIDAARDRLVPKMPLRFASFLEKNPIEDDRPYGEWLAAVAERRFAATLRPYKFIPPRQALSGDEGARSNETFAISSDARVSPGLKSLAFHHERLGRGSVELAVRRVPWPRTKRTSPDAPTCAEEVDWEPGAIFRLTLKYNGRTFVLKDDKTIPASRGCVLGYGITDIYAYTRPDDQVALAVILAMAVRGFEGSDRHFLAVTVLAKP